MLTAHDATKTSETRADGPHLCTPLLVKAFRPALGLENANKAPKVGADN
jgi:hypothetical protein